MALTQEQVRRQRAEAMAEIDKRVPESVIPPILEKIQNEMNSITDSQREALFNSEEFIALDRQVFQARVNMVIDQFVIEFANSEMGQKLYNRQHQLIIAVKKQTASADKKDADAFRALQVAAENNPKLKAALDIIANTINGETGTQTESVKGEEK